MNPRGLLMLVTALLVVPTASGSRESASRPARKPVLPFLENDYATALKEARARGVPIFIDAWAPW